MQRRAVSGIGVVLALLVASAGCGGGNEEPAGSGGRLTQLALVVPDWTSSYWDGLRTAALAAGQDQDIEVVTDAGVDQLDATAQIQRVTAMAREKPDCFGIAPVDPVRLLDPLLPVAKAGTPILNVGTRLDEGRAKLDGVPIASYIGGQDIEIGHLAARRMITAVGSGEVAMVRGAINDPNAAAQRSGFTDGVGGRLDVVVSLPTNDDYDTAVTVIRDMLSARPGLKGLFVTSDTQGEAAVKVVAALGLRDKVSIISVDGSEDGLRAVQAGTLTAVVARYPAIEGALLVRACRKLVDGGTVPPRVIVPAQLVDSTNVATALNAFPQPPTPFEDPLQ